MEKGIQANLFLHYAFDKWMEIKHPPFARCADHGVAHCRTLKDAEMPTKTHIVYFARREQKLFAHW